MADIIFEDNLNIESTSDEENTPFKNLENMAQQHTITKICIEDNDDDIDIIDISDDDDDLGNTLTTNHVLEAVNQRDAKYLNDVIHNLKKKATSGHETVAIKKEPCSDFGEDDSSFGFSGFDSESQVEQVRIKQEPQSEYPEEFGMKTVTGTVPGKVQRVKPKQVAKKSTGGRAKIINGSAIIKCESEDEEGSVFMQAEKEPKIIIKDFLKPANDSKCDKGAKEKESGSDIQPNTPRKPLCVSLSRQKPRKSKVPKRKVATLIEEVIDEDMDDFGGSDVELVEYKPSQKELDLALQGAVDHNNKEYGKITAVSGKVTKKYSARRQGSKQQENDKDESAFNQKPLRGFSGKYLCSMCDHSFSALSNLQRHVSRFHSSNEINLPNCHICGKIFIWKKYLDEHMESVHDHVPTCHLCGTVLKNRKTLEAHIKFVHGKKEKFPCPMCGKMFHQKRSLQAHMTVHAPRKFKCQACPRQFRLATHLKYHIRQAHTRENLVHCQMCGFGFTHGARLKVHMLTHFKIRPHKCHLCPSAFANKTQLGIHIMRHKGEKKHFCKACGQGFVCASALRIHSRVHTGEKPYACEICHQRFATTGNRKIHTRLKHTRERPYCCPVCGKTFNLTNGLKAHIRIHTDEKPYSCDICGKAFRQSSHLHTHKRTHTGERPYPCPHCYKTFTQQSHLTTHLVTHTGEKAFECDVCHKSFALAHSLKVHMRLHGKLAYTCRCCGDQFVTWNQYKVHQDSDCTGDEAVCSVCGKAYKEPAALIEHMKIHAKEATHMCTVCGKTFQHPCSLTSHMKIHTGERRFACDVCNASFAESSHLKSHMTQKHRHKK